MRDAEITFIKTLKGNLIFVNMVKEFLLKLKNKNVYQVDNGFRLSYYDFKQLKEKLEDLNSNLTAIIENMTFTEEEIEIEEGSEEGRSEEEGPSLSKIINSKIEKELEQLKEIHSKIEQNINLVGIAMRDYNKNDVPNLQKTIDSILNDFQKNVEDFLAVYSNLKFKKEQ